MRILNCIAAAFFLLAAVVNLEGQTPGSHRWSFATGDSVYSSPAIDGDGSVYVGSYDGKLYAFSPDGTNKWTFTAGGQILSSPAIGLDGTIYFGATNGKFYALTRNGVQKWAFTAGGSISLSSPALGLDGTIYFGCLDHKLYALNADGTKKWEFTAGAEIYSSPALGSDGTIFCGSSDRKLYALSSDGSKKWEYATAGEIFSSPAIGPNGEIYLASGNNFYAFTPGGSNLWQYALIAPAYSSAAVKADGSIYFGSTDGILHALNPNGTKLWDYVTTNAVHYSSPALASDGTIYVGSMNNKLYAVNADGSLRWIFTAGNPVALGEAARNWCYSSPVLGTDGAIYIGYNNGRLYAVNGSAGPAASPWPMFRRDSRHSAAGFVTRQLPDSYSPGVMMTVTLTATPPAAGTYYFVEDQMPAGWTVGLMNYNGTFDAQNRKVRFGPFFDATPRTFTYQVTPPQSDRGLKVFGGGATVNNWTGFIGGESSLLMVPTHPADNQPIDFRLTITELTAYGKAWKTGGSWPVSPNPIPVNYVAGAAQLWRAGEYYTYSTNVPDSFNWIAATNQIPVVPPLPTSDALNDATMIATMPFTYSPGVAFTVTIMVTPPTNAALFAVQDQPPSGWVVGGTTGGGIYDNLNGVVKWGPFFDGAPRALTYEVTPAAGAGGIEKFTGLASFDGVTLPIGGRREIVSDGDSLPAALRTLPLAYVPGKKLTVTLQVLAPANGVGCVVAEQPPAGWTVGTIGSNGVWDASSRLVKFTVFPNADATAQILTYQVTPPVSEVSTKWFVGTVSLDGLLESVQGDSSLSLSTLFPADIDPADGRIAIGEMVAYHAAWLQNSGSWLMPPIPIDMDYLTRAIMLWRAGEAYRHDQTISSPPLDWVSATPQAPFDIVPPSTWNAGLGTAVALGPFEYRAGVPCQVAIQVTTGNNSRVYAVEDQPPAGWNVSFISDSGSFDEANHKVKWGPFFGDYGRTLRYWVLPTASSDQSLRGVVAFSDGVIPIDHQYQFTLPRLKVLGYSTQAGTSLELSSPVGRYYHIQSSPDLVQWLLLFDVTNNTGVVQFTDGNSAGVARQYYRAYSP